MYLPSTPIANIFQVKIFKLMKHPATQCHHGTHETRAYNTNPSNIQNLRDYLNSCVRTLRKGRVTNRPLYVKIIGSFFGNRF